MGVPLAEKATVPVGAPAPGVSTVTVAVKVTDWPKTLVAGDAESPVVVGARLTVWLRALAVVDAVKSASPW
jgi:hypothetical protein